MAIKISLYCWILGQDKTNIFPVGILSSNCRPPEAIKKGMEPEINHLAANDLEIWKVNHARCTRRLIKALGVMVN